MNNDIFISVDWDRLNYIQDIFPKPEDTFNFFKEKSDYFGVYNFDKRSKKFSSREDDRTPSTLAKKRLTTIDFGASGKHKSIVDFIMDRENKFLRDSLGDLAARNSDQYMKYSNRNDINRAIKILSNLVGISDDLDLSDYTYVPPEPEPVVIRPAFKENYINRLLRDAGRKKNKAMYDKIISGLFRHCSKDETLSGIEKFSVGFDQYESLNDENTVELVSRVFIAERDIDGTCYGSYRYNRELTPKGLRRKDSKKVLIGSHLFKDFNLENPVIFSEGHSDVCVNNAKSLQTITSGASTISIGDNIEHLKGLTLHFFPDNDLAGIKGVSDKLCEIEVFNRSLSDSDKIKYKVFFWSNKIDGENFDVSFAQRDWVENFIQNYDLNDIKLSEEKDFQILLDSVNFSNKSVWSQVFKASKKKGYDFVDFHEEFESGTIEATKYQAFLKKYRY